MFSQIIYHPKLKPCYLLLALYIRELNSIETYMHRCLELAQLASGAVAPNPMVGSILVFNDQIIGEGYHREYGKEHAEVNCINSVKPERRHLISQSTLYVSLEPCAHFGKTPPCADLIIKHQIPKVIIGCRDPFMQVNGKGIEKLLAAEIDVTTGVLEEACKKLNKRFFTFHTEHRPYVILKWAQTRDGKIAAASGSRILISNEYSNRLVHQWRSEETAIVVGTNTALFDDPELSTRWWPGKNPIRVVVDINLRLPKTLKLFNGQIPTIVFNLHRHNLPVEKISISEVKEVGVAYYQVTEGVSLVHQMLHALYQMNIQSILVEGGSYLLQSFVDEGMWDEARVITNESLEIGDGLPAPVLKNHRLTKNELISSNTICWYAKRS